MLRVILFSDYAFFRHGVNNLEPLSLDKHSIWGSLLKAKVIFQRRIDVKYILYLHFMIAHTDKDKFNVTCLKSVNCNK